MRLMIRLDDQERDALLQLARCEKRDPRAQAALIIRRALETEGFLPQILINSAIDSTTNPEASAKEISVEKGNVPVENDHATDQEEETGLGTSQEGGGGDAR